MSNKGGTGAQICERLINQQTLKGGAIPTERREKAVNICKCGMAVARSECWKKSYRNEERHSVGKSTNLKVFKAVTAGISLMSIKFLQIEQM
jgi:hypothetical protein